MNPTHFKQLLRYAVIAALPVASQSACVPNTPSPTNEPIKIDDPCRSGEATRKTAQEAFSAQINAVNTPLTAAQCIALCKQTFAEQRIGGINDLAKLERINASDCKTENRPFSDIMGGPRMPTPSTLISCTVNYTAIHAAYTCPRPMPGRAPHGLHISALAPIAFNPIGQYLADMTAMETAAITAFRYLARELEAYGAPDKLIARAYQAADEEVRHAEMAGLLSEAYGGIAASVQVDDFRLRSLYEIALENAVEGCVHETFAAACGLWQSQQAELGVFRQVIGHITDEEMDHAALSWDIYQWIMPQLSALEQAHIREAQAEAIHNLMQDFKQESDSQIQQAFGLPAHADAARLFEQLKNAVWNPIA
ncbi:ferritin-like domain-containing protein [Thiofilum flexile]|uniref:ferritin-like domain-containing protein n=1 Tax=Thiofilum flexile TaxID=125627 RepID=UPI000369495E|nr:ferritin-like domain-containing protein [Thiofilum flexile]